MAVPSIDEMNAATRQRVTDLTQQVITAAKRGEDTAKLIQQAETAIADLPQKDRAALKRKLTEAKKTERAVTEPTEVTPYAEDFRSIEGMTELVAMGAERVREAEKFGLRLADVAKGIGEVILDMRRRVKHPKYDNLPDLFAQSKIAKNAAHAMYKQAAADIAFDDVEQLDAHAKVKRSVQNKMKDVTVNYLRGLDDNLDELDAFYPEAAEAVKRDPELTPTEAVYQLYERHGIKLPRKTHTELEREAIHAERAAIEAGEPSPKESESEATAEHDLAALQKSVKAFKAVAKHAPEYSPEERTQIKTEMLSAAGTIAAEAAKL